MAKTKVPVRTKKPGKRPSKPVITPPAEPGCSPSPLGALAGQPATISANRIEVAVNAPIARVWKGLVGETTKWWRRDFFTSATTKSFTIEPVVGGRAFEDYGNGGGALWFTVIAIDPPHLIELAGHLSPRFGGPLTSVTTFALREEGGRTIVEVSDAGFGWVKGDRDAAITEGWRLLVEDGLKAWIESGRRA